jgi:hypothetical protein
VTEHYFKKIMTSGRIDPYGGSVKKNAIGKFEISPRTAEMIHTNIRNFGGYIQRNKSAEQKGGNNEDARQAKSLLMRHHKPLTMM